MTMLSKCSLKNIETIKQEILNFVTDFINNSKIFYTIATNESQYKNSIIGIFFGGSFQSESMIFTQNSDIDIIIIYDDFKNKNIIDRFVFWYTINKETNEKIKIEFIPSAVSKLLNLKTDCFLWHRNFYLGANLINNALLKREDFLYINKKYSNFIDNFLLKNEKQKEFLEIGIYFLFSSLFAEKNTNNSNFTSLIHQILNNINLYNHNTFLEVNNKYSVAEKYITLLMIAALKMKWIEKLSHEEIYNIKEEITTNINNISDNNKKKILEFLIDIYSHILNNPIDIFYKSNKLNKELKEYVEQ